VPSPNAVADADERARKSGAEAKRPEHPPRVAVEPHQLDVGAVRADGGHRERGAREGERPRALSSIRLLTFSDYLAFATARVTRLSSSQNARPERSHGRPPLPGGSTMKGIRQLCVAVVVLAVATAVVVPAAAGASKVDSALAQETYYSSYGEPTTAAQPRAVPVAKDDPGAWKVAAVGAGALVLVLGAAELVTLSRLRRLRTT
jgi:hypothetical protein